MVATPGQTEMPVSPAAPRAVEEADARQYDMPAAIAGSHGAERGASRGTGGDELNKRSPPSRRRWAPPPTCRRCAPGGGGANLAGSLSLLLQAPIAFQLLRLSEPLPVAISGFCSFSLTAITWSARRGLPIPFRWWV